MLFYLLPQRAVYDRSDRAREHDTDPQHLGRTRSDWQHNTEHHLLHLHVFLIKPTLRSSFVEIRLSCDPSPRHTGREFGHECEGSPTSNPSKTFTYIFFFSVLHRRPLLPFPALMEELLKHLTEVSIRQQQIMEHMASRQSKTEQELTTLCVTAAQRVPVLDPRVQATQLLPKMTVHDGVENYLQMFEDIATREDSPQGKWARVLAPLLTVEVQRAYFTLSPEQRESYEELRKEILARVGLSPICAAQLFQDWEYKTRLPTRAQAAELTRLTRHWLLAGGPTASQVTERVVINKLLRA